MENKYSRKQLEELYNCSISKDSGFDDDHLFWVAQGLPITEDGEDDIHMQTDGIWMNYMKIFEKQLEKA